MGVWFKKTQPGLICMRTDFALSTDISHCFIDHIFNLFLIWFRSWFWLESLNLRWKWIWSIENNWGLLIFELSFTNSQILFTVNKSHSYDTFQLISHRRELLSEFIGFSIIWLVKVFFCCFSHLSHCNENRLMHSQMDQICINIYVV